MSDTNPILTKTCSICGKAKPLAAFLQLAGPQGTTYGNVCATCRSAGLDKPKAPEFEELTRDDLELTRDAKARLKLDKDKKEIFTHKEELEKDEKRKESEKRSAQGKAKEKTAKDDKGRRETFIEQRKFSEAAKEKPSDAMADLAAKEQRIDTIGPVQDTYFTGKRKHVDSPLVKMFKVGLLGAGSPLARSEIKNMTDQEIVDKTLGPKTTRGR